MNIREVGFLGTLLVSAEISFGGESRSSMRVQLWVPGMNEPQILTAQNESFNLSLDDSPWAYVIKGISGSIALGNENEEGRFWSLGRNRRKSWNGESSWASLALAINGEVSADPALFFSVSGDSAGDRSPFVTNFLANPQVLFSDEDGTLAIRVSPILDSDQFPQGEGIANVNPYAEFSLIADVYRRPPQPSGDVDADRILWSRTDRVTISWSFTRGEEAFEGNQAQFASVD